MSDPLKVTGAMCLAVIGMLMTGCQFSKPPVATLESVEYVEMTDEGLRVNAVIRLANPNPEASLPLTKARYSARIGTAYRYEGDFHPNQTLSANDEQTLVLPIAVPLDQAFSAARVPIEFSGLIEYDPPDEIREALSEIYIPLPEVGVVGEMTVELSQEVSVLTP